MLTMIVSIVSCILISYITTCNSAMEGFIEGGEYAKIESFPHSVYLFMVCSEHQSCGGSILTQYIVLTAAHCFEQCLKRHEILAFAGSENTQEMIIADQIKNYFLHEYYDPVELLNDIALGSVKTPLPLEDTMKRVIIARNFPGVMMARMAGWGVVNDETSEDTDKLKMVTQILQPTATCKQSVKLKRGMMCAKNSFRNRPTPGDSGSALVSKDGQEIGLVSWRQQVRKDIIIYTNVSYYYDWILTHSRQLHCEESGSAKRKN